ncbi:hypothetical protein HXX76_012261 [Chlamydomonas incerta]|uniref:Uncharacterized protein n=1 Tax=Chlamydomonas incerta TaxID=51695 RepID=A0A835SPZ9_CHLIN|nr:hypothetical protein HXX76_012261 [Chlamydomonas incerta]|eukprot:KAG2427608.1 hypothetical protein HXX76_012261 [Chlamydomonas incerta]
MRHQHHEPQRQGQPGQQQREQPAAGPSTHSPPAAPPHPANNALLATLMLAAALVGFAAGAWSGVGGGGGAAAAGCSKYESVAGRGGHSLKPQAYPRRQAAAAAGPPGAQQGHVLAQARRGHWREEAEAAALAVLDIPQPTAFEPVFPENRAASLTKAAAAATAGGVAGNASDGGSVGGAAVVLLRDELAFLRRKVRALRIAYGSAYCDLHGIGPSGGFCLQPPAATATATAAAAAAATAGLVTGTLLDRPLCAAVAKLVAGTHVADFGAGRGQYGTCLLAGGGASSPSANAANVSTALPAAATAVTVVGGAGDGAGGGGGGGAVSYSAYDGGEGVEAATGGAVRFLDLAEPTWLGMGYDWVISLEVGEHIPPRLEGVFLANLLRHAGRGLVLSWAVPGQGGHHHVNERPNDYIVARVAELGGGAFRPNATAAAQLRAASSLAWFRNTLLVFDRV